jgi:hypothetical protein
MAAIGWLAAPRPTSGRGANLVDGSLTGADIFDNTVSAADITSAR